MATIIAPKEFIRIVNSAGNIFYIPIESIVEFSQSTTGSLWIVYSIPNDKNLKFICTNEHADDFAKRITESRTN